MEATAPLVNAVVNNAVSLQLTNQSDAASNQLHHDLALLSCRLVAPGFVINCTEVRAVQWPEITKFIQVSDITALSDEGQRMMYRISV